MYISNEKGRGRKPQFNGHFPILPFSCVDHLIHFGSSSLPMRDYSLRLPPHLIISLFLSTSVPGTLVFIIQVSLHFHFSFSTTSPLSNMFNPFCEIASRSEIQVMFSLQSFQPPPGGLHLCHFYFLFNISAAFPPNQVLLLTAPFLREMWSSFHAPRFTALPSPLILLFSCPP